MGKHWDMDAAGRAKISAFAQERYKNNSKTMSCLNCAKTYKISLSRFNNGRGKYCSRTCKGIASRGIRPAVNTEFKKGHKPWNYGLRDELSPTWKGDEVGIRPLHYWVEKHLGKPSKCEHCGTTSAKRFEWSNISREYKRVLSDWQRLCTKCHMEYDGHSIVNNRNKIKL